MQPLRTVELQCPYCGEPHEVEIDCTVGAQRYVEDCGVCCCPILLDVGVDESGEPIVTAIREND